MSEYQHIYFAAFDRPLDDEELDFMHQQSTRADISRWEFRNEYHFGDFHGNTDEMLRRGYDVYLHYANFGIRRLMFRLPGGLPWPKDVFDAYRLQYEIEWQTDNKRGPAGTLRLDPEADPDSYDENFFEFESLKAALPGIRRVLIAGDLRPFYLAWLASTWNEDTREPPVPAGLGDLPPELETLCEFYELSPDLVEAASQQSSTAPGLEEESELVRAWLDNQSAEELRALMQRVLDGEETAVRVETLARIRGQVATLPWPTTPPTRTLGKLREAAEAVKVERLAREQQAREKARRKRLEQIAADSRKTVAEVKRLVRGQSRHSYEQAAQLLVDLREALGPTRGPKRAQAVAEKLVAQYPTRRLLKSVLRKRGLLPKR